MDMLWKLKCVIYSGITHQRRNITLAIYRECIWSFPVSTDVEHFLFVATSAFEISLCNLSYATSLYEWYKLYYPHSHKQYWVYDIVTRGENTSRELTEMTFLQNTACLLNMHTFLLCFVLWWLHCNYLCIYKISLVRPYSSELLNWHWGNRYDCPSDSEVTLKNMGMRFACTRNSARALYLINLGM